MNLWLLRTEPRLQIVPVSLSSSCVMRLVRRAWHKKWPGEILGLFLAPRISRSHFFPVFFRVTHDGLQNDLILLSWYCWLTWRLELNPSYSNLHRTKIRLLCQHLWQSLAGDHSFAKTHFARRSQLKLTLVRRDKKKNKKTGNLSTVSCSLDV